MAVKPIPEGYHNVTPYLVVKGAARLIEFLKQAFDAQEIYRMDMPDGTVAHAEVRIGDSTIMTGEGGAHVPAMTAGLSLYVPDVDASYRRALQAGAMSVEEPTDKFYGDRTAGVKDTSGNFWWIGTHKEDVAPEELKRRMQAAMQRQHA